MILNKTDWEPFAESTGVTLEDLTTIEGVVEVSRKYYAWTDDQTPGIPGDGKAFYGRDALPNYFFVGAQQLGQPLLKVENNQAHVNADQEVFRKLWDNYYVPMVSGWFGAYGKFRSDDVKTGYLLAYTGSTASAGYFPKQVETETGSHPIDYEVLPVPIFAGGKNVIVQQGAGMAVTKSDVKRETAAVEFLRWFTQAENNVRFGAGSGYLPVLKEANRVETFRKIAENQHLEMDPVTDSCITFSLERMEQAEFFTPQTFTGGTALRSVLEHSLADKITADLADIQQKTASGADREAVLAKYTSDAAFENWYRGFVAEIEDALKG